MINASKLTIVDAMRPEPFTCINSDPADHTLRRMRAHQLDTICVVDERARPIGLFTVKDACFESLERNEHFRAFTVADVISGATPLPVCQTNASLTQAERLMRLHRSPAIAVVDEEQALVGMLRLSDILDISTSSGVVRDRPSVLETVATVQSAR